MTESLILSDVTISIAQRRVVDSVSLEVPAGKIVALLGPNGAGKSELVLGVAGVLPIKGRVCIGDHEIGSGAARAAGIAAVPEGHRTLAGLSVLDNLRAAGPRLAGSDLMARVDHAFEVFPELLPLAGRKSGALSGGQQQMVALAQALVCRPKFMLIDEMSLGLAPVIIERLIGVVQALRERGIGILLIEQFTQLALDIADHCFVLAQGRIHFSGPAQALKHDSSVLTKAYLG